MFGGLRRVEVCRLKWTDVDYANQTMTVMGKGDKIRKVPIHPVLCEALQRYQQLERSDWVVGTRHGGQLKLTSFDDDPSLWRILWIPLQEPHLQEDAGHRSL